MSRISKAICKHPYTFIIGSLCLIFELALATLWYWESEGKDKYEPMLVIFGVLTVILGIQPLRELFVGKKDEEPNIHNQQKPFIILEPTPRTPSGNLLGLTMKNIGDGAALNISVGSESDSAIVPFLAKEEALLLRIETAFHKGKPPILVWTNNQYILFLDPSSAMDNIVFTIRFQNIQQQSYFVEESITIDGWEILKSGKVEDHAI